MVCLHADTQTRVRETETVASSLAESRELLRQETKAYGSGFREWTRVQIRVWSLKTTTEIERRSSAARWRYGSMQEAKEAKSASCTCNGRVCRDRTEREAANKDTQRRGERKNAKRTRRRRTKKSRRDPVSPLPRQPFRRVSPLLLLAEPWTIASPWSQTLDHRQPSSPFNCFY